MSDNRAYMPRSKRQDHETPWELFDMLDAEFDFTVDAAASPYNAKLENYWTEEIDGLKQNWAGHTVFINPPFAVKQLECWVIKAYEETRTNEHTKVVMVVPVKSDQDWWEYAIQGEIRYINKRVKFEGNKGTFPGPIAVLVFGKYVRPRNLIIRVPPKKDR